MILTTLKLTGFIIKQTIEIIDFLKPPSIFFQQYAKSSTRVRNSNNPSLLDFPMNNNDLFDVSFLPPLGTSNHSTVGVSVNVFIK